MKLILIFALIGISVANTSTVSQLARELGFATFDQQFNAFKINNNKNYDTEDEELRKLNFLSALRVIEEHNELYRKGEETHELAINQFADLSDDEYQQMFLQMPNPTTNSSQMAEPYVADSQSFASLPGSLDWRAQGKVTPVKNQGGCGSCWSFSVVGAIESLYAIKHNQNLDLSEEQLVDCMNSKCGGQWIYDGYKYVIANGVESESNYPYTAASGGWKPCHENKGLPHTHIAGYRALGRGISDTHPLATDNEIMSAVQQNGPISMMFNANGDAFRYYKNGVLTNNDMGWTGSHAVIIVGWGTEGGHNYWLVKNSWGTGWGDQGYFKMVRGQNLRHVNEYLYFPYF